MTNLWYTIEEIASKTGMSIRTATRRLYGVSEINVRFRPSTGGRPKKEYHFSCLPELAAAHATGTSQTTSNNPQATPCNDQSSPVPAAEDDLVRARFRLQAVKEFQERCKLMSKEDAAIATARDWANRPRTQTVTTSERLPGGHIRMTKKDVSLVIFKPGTLRVWAGTWQKQKDILCLVDRKKENVGRRGVEIPQDVLSYIYGLSTSTARADVAKAVAWGRDHWHGETSFPSVSIDTWRRRIRAFDPRRAGKDLMHSVARFRTNHTADVEIDWQKLPYNGMWMIDDVRQDWYALTGGDKIAAIRPYAYAIMRARTRKWVAFVATEHPITQAQVRELVGFAISQPAGGLPDVLKFEHGTVAGDAYLDDLLESLGVRVSRTGMNGGAVVPGATPDIATGHFQGKALIERAFRSHHDAIWNVAGQVGPEEKTTAPARLQRWIRAQTDPDNPAHRFLPTGMEIHARIKEAMEKQNNSPHSGLPEMVTESGEVRHATPNEIEAALATQEIRRMDSRLLPLFNLRGVSVPVTRNGFILNNNCYGRFDDDLARYERVLAYASEVTPELAYVHELGRCVEMYVKADPGDHTQYGRKEHSAKVAKNRYQQAIAEAMASGDSVFLASMMMLDSPVKNRKEEIVAPATLVDRTNKIASAISAHRDRAAVLDNRFNAPQPDAPVTRQQGVATRRRGLLSRSRDLDEHLAALGAGKGEA